MQYIIRDCEADINAPLGGKARSLAALRDASLVIPAWVVVQPQALQDSLGPQRWERLGQASTADAMQAVFEQVELSAPVLAELRTVLTELGSPEALLAVRSSASDEDGDCYSFAGQLESYLFVPVNEVPRRVVDVWRSGFTERIIRYRQENDLPLTPRPPAVLVQTMIAVEASGVAFGADPVSGRRGIAVVSAVFGLGSALVSGAADADTWHVDRDGQIVARRIVEKKLAYAPAPGSPEGVCSVVVPRERATQPVLTDEQILAVAQLVRRAGDSFGRPQDIEWGFAEGRLYLLQSRPITSLQRRPDPDGVHNIWDNSNIAESYSGITTPLTFSFIRRAYESVYRQLCRMFRVPPPVIDANCHVFRRMLGLVRGTVYYNLLNWYRLLALLPGFQANRAFMEQMMGVKEPLPDAVVAELGAASWLDRFRDRFRLLRSALAMIIHHFTLPRQIRGFYTRLEKILGKSRPHLSLRRPEEIVAYYRDMERQLVTRWDAPLLNDFFAMVFFGMLGQLTRQWCGDSQGTLRNDLICGEGGMISTEPAERVRAMALAAAPHTTLVAALCRGSLRDIDQAMTPDFRRLRDDYLERFGDRCLEELKLETSTLLDDPLPLLRSVGQLACRQPTNLRPASQVESALRAKAESRVAEKLRGKPFRRLFFQWVLKHARARVRDRENLRFERTRLFGRARQIFVELGQRFYALDLLDHPRDVFYLEVDEVLDYVEGTANCTDLRGLAAVRRAEFDCYRQMPRPADRFQTRGLVYIGHNYESSAVKAVAGDGEERSGLGCCPGVVRGKVRVITQPRGAELHAGEILVAERTDPGWIMLFPSAAGLLVERGSLLSHSAIVARELGIPAIVSVPDVTHWLKTGDEVELDGSRGIVRRLTCTGDHR